MLHFSYKTTLLLGLLWGISFKAHSQKEPNQNYWANSHEIGLNFTPFISKLIPFNFTEANAGLVGLKWKNYGTKNAFRMSFGANVSDDDFFDLSGFLYLSIGYEKRRSLGRNWSYTTGWEAVGQAVERDDSAFLGVSKFYGIEYNFTDRVFLSTEAALRMGWSTETPTIVFDLPISLFFNVRLFK